MKEDYLEFHFQYINQDIANILPDELALIESVMPELIFAMMHEADDGND